MPSLKRCANGSNCLPCLSNHFPIRAYTPVIVTSRRLPCSFNLFRYFRARRALDFRKYNQNSCPRNNPLQHLHATFYPRENTHTPLTPTSHSAAQITLEHNGNQQVSCHTADLVLSSKISRRTSTQSLQLPHKIKGCLCSHKRKESRLVQLWSYRL